MSLELYSIYTVDTDESPEGVKLEGLYVGDYDWLYSDQLANPSYSSYISLESIEQIIRYPILKKYSKIYLLHDDETIAKDITEWVQDAGNIEKNSESGQRRSTTLTFENSQVYKKVISSYYKDEDKKKSGYKYVDTKKSRFNPTLMYDDFQSNVKIKIVSRMHWNGKIYEIDEGVFVAHDPKMSESRANKTLTIQFYDKFALLDGTISGDGEFEYEIEVGSTIYDAILQLIRLPKNKTGQPFDLKDINFPAKYRDLTLAYTIKKTGENAIGELIKEMCQSISCDVGYDAHGILTISDTLADMDPHYRQVAWTFKQDEYDNPSLDIKRSQIKNRIVVIGNNINGFLCRGAAENTDPNSLYSVYGPFGVRSQKITDNLIPSNKMCEERAKYELQKSMRNYVTLTFQCPWIPHLEPGDIIRWTKEDWDIIGEEFVVNSISTPFSSKDFMSITATNLKEISQ